MDSALLTLIAASIAFVGSHFAMSHPLRAGMVRMLGEKGFLGVYSLVSLAAMVWMVLAFRAAPPGAPVGGALGEALWIAVSVVSLLALVLLLGSFRGNPAMPEVPAETIAAAAPSGAFRITRHPMMWGIALWAVSHILLVGAPGR